MDNSALPHELVGRLPLRRSDGPRGPEGSEKKFLAKISRNPLISLVSDERIQGNPSFSNPLFEGFQSQTGAGQEIPNGPPSARDAKRAPISRLEMRNQPKPPGAMPAPAGIEPSH